MFGSVICGADRVNASQMDANKNILAPKIAERIAVSTKVNEVTLKATQDINAIYSDQVTREADARKHAKVRHRFSLASLPICSVDCPYPRSRRLSRVTSRNRSLQQACVHNGRFRE